MAHRQRDRAARSRARDRHRRPRTLADAFAIEAGIAGCQAVDDYVVDGTGTARAALATVGFWTWHTEEVLALVEWLRAHNATLPRDRRVRFRGIDPLDEPGAHQWTRHRAAEINALSALSTKGSALRDKYMAEAVQRIAPDDKVIVWAHNGHLSRDGRGSLGAHLARSHGSRYYALGFATYEGSFQALKLPGSKLTEFVLGPPRPGSLEGRLARVPVRDYLIDLRPAPGDERVARWVHRRTTLRGHGSTAFLWPVLRRLAAPIRPREFDGIAFVRHTTRAKPLVTEPGGRVSPSGG